MGQRENDAATQRFGDAVNTGRLEVLHEVMAPAVVDHDPAPDQGAGPEGDFLGVPPTGRRISARGVQIARFERGRMVERWGSSDQLGILQQLGAVPAPAQ